MSVYEDLNEAVALINALGRLPLGSSNENNQSITKQALRLSKALTATLEAPEDAAVNMSFAIFTPMSARIAVDLKLFELIASHSGPITAAELSSLSGGEDQLIIRILRPLSAVGFVKEVAEQTWVATPITKAMANDTIAAGHRMMWELMAVAVAQAPKFLKETRYRSPANSQDGLVQYAYQTKLSVFELISTIPQMQRDFDIFMGSMMGTGKYWIDWYPIQELIIDGARDDSVLMIDIGGGNGYDLQAFERKYPQRGRLVLQDRPSVIDNIKDMHPAIEYFKYDFFTSQPIQGARVYFYHHILHDWPDDKCLIILQQVKRAMEPGYSKLLLHELILPDKEALTVHASFDLAVMIFNSGTLRTRKQWGRLLESAGLELVKVWVPEKDTDGIVEAVVKEN
ncbi:hypothetical protein G7Y89_g832 [Cudoniella acicularis]|uniref:O-methyltransferase domain-containing protein n=1 Tax=Cudoniella acicularis TaxID=354080 RepID=A0A8H4W7K1_9HELO|nr:hypothetical protein G7Y89_g832 [Cudoniella acicularis]